MKLLLAACSAAVLILGCRMNSKAQDEHAAQGCKQQLERDFDERASKLPDLEKDEPRARMRLLQTLIDNQDASSRNCVSNALLRKETRETTFDDLLAQALCERFLKSREESALQKLLQVHCPNYVTLVPLEFLLANSGDANNVLLITKAYPHAENAVSSSALLGCLKRAFPSISLTNGQEQEFVRSCEEWYKSNRGNLKINDNYPHLVNSDHKGSPDLFLPKR